MLIKVSEKCLIGDNYYKGKKYGLRQYIYKSNKPSLSQCIRDIEQNFNSDNIVSSVDYFKKECLDSEIIRYELVEE